MKDDHRNNRKINILRKKDFFGSFFAYQIKIVFKSYDFQIQTNVKVNSRQMIDNQLHANE